MDYKDRAQLLKSQEVSIEMIATALGISVQAVYQTLRDGRSSKRIAKAISDVCNKPLTDMFPYYKESAKKEAQQKKLNDRLAKYA